MSSGSTYRRITVNGATAKEHVAIAERAIGRKLPAGVVVHHMDEDPRNNAPSNLVICASQAYHMLLHQRTRALDACGNADWRKCWICQTWDSPDNLRVRPAPYGSVHHLACASDYESRRMASKSQREVSR